MVEVDSFARLNFGLWDLSINPFRIDGSTGVYTNLRIGNVKLLKDTPYFLDIKCDDKERIKSVIKRCEKRIGKSNFSLSVESFHDFHIGLGSGTQLSMSIVAAFDKEYHLNLSIDEMALLAGSGGTSCVGVYSFLFGGFIVDSGRKFPSEKSQIGPGETFSFPKVSPLLLRLEMPKWYLCLAKPKTSRKVFAKYEMNLFKKYTPISDEETNQLCKWILTGILPSLKTNDFESFCYCLQKCSTLGFKKREIETYGDCVRSGIEILTKHGASGVGMSSFGPTVFGFFPSKEEALNKMELLENTNAFDKVYLTELRNSGALIKCID